MIKGRYNIIVGAMAGSEAKGKLSAYLAAKHPIHALCMAASPNAGHTFVDDGGKKQVTYHLPCASLTCDAPIFLGPSSIIRIPSLLQEISDNDIDPSRITIDPRAAIIDDYLLDMEKKVALSDIGSTLQGVGSARSRKLMRPEAMVTAATSPELWDNGIVVGDTSPTVNSILDDGGTVLCEMTQGFDLCLEHGIHRRYCTSKIINPAMAMAEAGVAPSFIGSTYGVLRPFPIRVNNRTGTSGPYPGAKEISWSDVAASCAYPGRIEDFVEYTTTTKLPRRVFSFSWVRFEAFVRVCRPTSLCLQFANYIDWSNFGAQLYNDLAPRTLSFIKELEKVAKCSVTFVGTGPEYSQMVDMEG